jgi:hypothetical protein
MTFLEAAIEVLRREGKPLPVKRLAELAVQHNLLSVVGRDPEGTMQARLDEVLDKGPTHPELLRVRPDTFGLRAYPPRPYPPVREGAEAAAAQPEAEGAETEDEADELTTAEAPQPGARRGRRRRRRGRGGAEGGAETEPVAAAEAEREAAPESGTASAPVATTHPDELLEDEEDPEFEVEADSGSAAPLMVSTAGDEELTRSGEEREVRNEIRGGRREERGRRRRGERGRRDEARPQRDAAPQPQQQQHQRGRGGPAPLPPQALQAVQAPANGTTPAPLPPVVRGLGGELVELLRANDARPQHVRALAQEVERRKILDGRPQPEIVREVRMALHAETSARGARGLRPRVRPLGGGNYALVDRKLDDELVSAERALEVALERQAAATQVAVRRRLTRLSPFSFEQLGRCVAEALGVERPTLVRRGEGVAYYGGERTLGVLGGAQRARVLVGVRPGEVELGRRAVGELRAGLDARGFDEGILIALGRLSAEGREELRAGRAVTVFDGDSLPALLIERRLGVRVAHAPIPYLDLDFFSEINET